MRNDDGVAVRRGHNTSRGRAGAGVPVRAGHVCGFAQAEYTHWEALQARYRELSTRFDLDTAQAATTWRGFLERFCDTPTLCFMTHFPSPSVGRLTRWGEGFRCEPT